MQEKRKAWNSTLSAGTGFKKKAREWRTRRRAPTVAQGAKYLEACRGEPCYLRVPGVCCSVGYASGTVVPCHSNWGEHGKGGALKAVHEFTVPGCAECHRWLDAGAAAAENKRSTFDRALAEWAPVRAAKMDGATLKDLRRGLCASL